MTGFNIRRLVPADARAFRAFRLDGLERHPEAFGASADAEAALDVSRWVAWIGAAHVMGGFDGDGQMIGCASLSPSAGDKRQHVGQIGAFYVAPEWRGRGLSKALLDACIRAANGRFLRITLTVNASNRAAIALYQRHGFTAYGHLTGALFVGGVYYDEVLMVHEMLQNSN